MNSKLAEWCEGLIEAGLLVALIGAPLFFNIHSDRVFEPDKLTLIRSVALLMSVAWLARFIDTQGWQDLEWLGWRSERSIWRMPFVIPVFLLVIVYVISTIFSVVPRTSWAGSYQRLQGTYTTLSYIVIFALALATIRRREQINRIVTTVIITSIPISLYALLQHYGLDPLPWGGDVQRRVAGHMGNAIFIAAYLIMAVPLTVARIIDAFTNILNDEELSYADVIRSSVYIFTLAIQLVAIYWSFSRGPLLGLLVGMFAFVLILLVSLRNAATDENAFGASDILRAVLLLVLSLAGAFLVLDLLLGSLSGQVEALAGTMSSFVAFIGAVAVTTLLLFALAAARRGWRWLWLSWMLLAVFLAGWLLAFNLPQEVAEPYMEQPLTGDVLGTLAEWRELPAVGRFGRLLESEGGTGRVRVLIWEGALELIQPHEPLAFPDGKTDTFNFLRPLIGYGPESMYVAYNRFYLPELATVEARNASPDRSHNETFDALVITGIAGFLVWQLLYLSVFYYGFRWLGVARTKRDRNILIALWIVGAVVSAVFLTQWQGAEFLGVAIPFGSIGGLVLYLIYYALFTRAEDMDETEDRDPFQVDRLLMMALLAAVLAHYVEVHFGIAIAATRVHFFVYIALMFLLGYLLPRIREEQTTETVTRSRRRTRRLNVRGAGWIGPVLGMTFVLAVITGILGYEFMNYAQPPDLQVQTLEDVPSAGSILHQAFFVHPGQDFSDSPFVFLMITLTWALGVLAALSEMVKLKIISLEETAGKVIGNAQRVAAVVFVGLVVAGAALRFMREGDVTTTTTLGQALLLIWAAMCLFATLRLFQNHDNAGATAGVVAAAGLSFSLPVMVASGGLYGFLMLAGSAVVLYMLWDDSWNDYLLPGLVMSLLSLGTGLAFAYVQAAQIRSAIFLGPQVQQQVSQIERVLLTTDQFAGFLTLFYTFIIGLMLLAAFALAWRDMSRVREVGTTAGYVSVILLFALGLYLVNVTNIQVIQADIVYKQARPLDQQATRGNDPALWDVPIAIYEHAIELAPLEDFYYLFLGRAYLEKSGVTQDPAAQQQLLEVARERLLEAQQINPLNTDHTANLARLTTRWASLDTAGAEQDQLLAQAKNYYQEALALSPQNSVIRNEYGNLLATLDNDCQAAIDTYEESLDIDPYYANTYYSLAGVYELCAPAEPEEQTTYYRRAAELLQEGLAHENRPRNAGTLLVQAGQLYQQAGEYEAAIAALEEAQTVETQQVPAWNIDFRLADIYRAMGDLEQAERLATRALETAPQEAQPQIQTFLDQLTGSN